jgi:RNA polymerase sigma-70 factor (family 1)
LTDHHTYKDEELLLLLNTGDQDAFTELYHRHHSGIYHYQLAFVKIPSIAEDLTQEVFLKIWEARERLQVHSSFAAYLYRVSRNSAIDFMKKIAADRALCNQIANQMPSSRFERDSTELQSKEYTYLYKQAVDSLPKQRRAVFLLCREEGKTYEEAARQLGISRHTVKEYMAESLRSLRNFLSEKAKVSLLLVLIWRLL